MLLRHFSFDQPLNAAWIAQKIVNAIDRANSIPAAETENTATRSLPDHPAKP